MDSFLSKEEVALALSQRLTWYIGLWESSASI